MKKSTKIIIALAVGGFFLTVIMTLLMITTGGDTIEIIADVDGEFITKECEPFDTIIIKMAPGEEDCADRLLFDTTYFPFEGVAVEVCDGDSTPKTSVAIPEILKEVVEISNEGNTLVVMFAPSRYPAIGNNLLMISGAGIKVTTPRPVKHILNSRNPNVPLTLSAMTAPTLDLVTGGRLSLNDCSIDSLTITTNDNDPYSYIIDLMICLNNSCVGVAMLNGVNDAATDVVPPSTLDKIVMSDGEDENAHSSGYSLEIISSRTPQIEWVPSDSTRLLDVRVKGPCNFNLSKNR